MVRLALIAALLLGGCAANRQYFRPTEREHGQTIHGYPEALYSLVGPQGQFGEAKVWSRGAYLGRQGETIIDVILEIHDTSGEPIVVDPAELRLEAIRVHATTLRDLPAQERKGSVVPAGSIQELVYHFSVPPDIAPGDVNALLFRWAVHTGSQRYGQRTPFVAEYRSGGYGYPYPYYYCDPFAPLCSYPYGYYAPFYGPPFYGPPYYHSVIVPYAHPAVIVHPRH